MGEVRNAMVYIGNSQRQLHIAGEVIDISRGVKFDGPAGNHSDVPAKPTYGSLTATQRADYLRWLAEGRTSLPVSGYLHLFICGLERRALDERRDITAIFDEILAQLALRKSADEQYAQLLKFGWFLVARDPTVIDEARLRKLTRATPNLWPGGRVAGVLLNWFIVARANVAVWAAYLIAARHPNAQQPDTIRNTAEDWKQHGKQFQNTFNQRFPTGIALGIDHPKTAVEYEPINPALVKCICAIQNPWQNKAQFDVLADLWNTAWNQTPTKVATEPERSPPRKTESPSTNQSTIHRVVETVMLRLNEAVAETRKEAASTATAPTSSPPATPPPRPNRAEPPPLIRGLTWFGSGKDLELPIVGKVANPMVYACLGPSDEPTAIRLDLAASAKPYIPTEERELWYWPRYDELTEGQRRYYLDWIASGRVNVPVELGYTFLFLYGLERRALVERQDIPLIIDEVLRLKSLYATADRPVSRSFDGYTDNFLSFLAICESEQVDSARAAAIRQACRSWNDDTLAATLGRFALENRPLDGAFAYLLASELPDAQQSVVIRRAPTQHRDLFMSRFEKQFPTGFVLQVSKRPRRYAYRPASATLKSMEAIGPNPWGIQSQFKVLVDLWNKCVDDLRKFSAAQRSASETSTLTPEAWSALPPELRNEIEHPLAAVFNEFIHSHVSAENGHVHVTAQDVATILQIPLNGQITSGHSRRIAERIDDLGYAIEPDIRLTGRKYEADQMVALFHRPPSPESLNPEHYAPAACMLKVGIALAGIDGHIEEDELSALAQQIQGAFDLNEAEERRLHALRGLLVATGVELGEVSKLLRQFDTDKRELMGELILAIVSADGVVTSDELNAVRKLYASLGFEKKEVDDVLARLRATDQVEDDEPVVVAGAIAGAEGEAIPAQPAERENTVRLNRDAIAAILRESQDVARMLAAAMNLPVEHSPSTEAEATPAAEPAADSPPTPSSPATTVATEPGAQPEVTVDPTLPARYAAFYQVIVTKTTWSRTEIAALAKSHGLMLSGAIDAINDWSTEQKGGPLLYEEGEHFTLEQSYLN